VAGSTTAVIADFDNDGNRDIFVANGYRRDVFDGDVQIKLAEFVQKNRSRFNSPQEMFDKAFKEFIEVYNPIKVKNYLFRNSGDLHFENASDYWGFNEPSFSNGAAVGDLDNDGDLDLIVSNLDEEAFVYENLSAAKTNHLKVMLQGPAGNTSGLGAKVTVYYDGQLQYFENKTVRGYLSSNEPVVHFGLGQQTAIDSVKVDWNNGRITSVKRTSANQTLTLRYADAVAAPATRKVFPAVFDEATAQLLSEPFSHKENVFNEFEEQVLLPHMFSKSGPFITVGDVDGDGSDDFYVGGAAGQSGALYVQRSGKMVKQPVQAFATDKDFEDMGSAFLDVDNDGDLDLYVVSGGSEFADRSEMYQDRLYVNDGKAGFTKATLPKTESSGSCVVSYDIDGDGDLDVFRGGQVIAGVYPKSPRSYVFINEGGKLTDKTLAVSPGLFEVGMVNSAVTVDLTGDGQKELVVVGEWMPIRIFGYESGKLTEISGDLGLELTNGWWNKVVADDLDGDGDQDLVLGNIGENYKFKASAEKPFQVFANDFDGNGTNDIFLAKYLGDSLLVPIRGRQCTSQQMPGIARRFPTYISFANSDLQGILGSDIENAMHFKAHLFSSVMLINEGGQLRIQRLPVEAQLSSVHGIMIGDFDGDGQKDILIAGNKFDTEVETTAADASPGLLMKGLGGLKFKPLKPLESGFFVPYNVKDIQALKVNNQLTVLVGINDGTLRVFRNIPADKRNGIALAR
jgi:hypothetical protein